MLATLYNREISLIALWSGKANDALDLYFGEAGWLVARLHIQSLGIIHKTEEMRSHMAAPPPLLPWLRQTA